MPTTVPRHRWLAGLLAAAMLATTGVAASAALPADAPTTASGASVDVVVRAADSASAAAAVVAVGGTVDTELAYLGGVTAAVDPAGLAELAARADVQVTRDHELELSATDLVETGPATVADQAQLAAMDLPDHWTPAAGQGVGVALLDTGVAEVPELEGRVVRGPDYSGDEDGIDRHGHGTFMAGLIAGDGRASDPQAPRYGVAPGAHIVSLKLAGRDGVTSLSRVLDAIGWVITHQDEHAIRVVNLSLGVRTNRSPQADPLAAAVQAAWASGLTVVTASGNEGSGTVTSPGRDLWVITVGSTDQHASTPTVPEWSGAGKVVGRSKPELLAPGVSTVSLRAPGSAVDEDHPEAHVDDRYMRGSGTSMSTALVAGAVAVLAEYHPFATPDDFKGALVATGGSVAGQTGSVVDVGAADVAEPDPSWRQTHPIGFAGLGGRAKAGMPWNRADAPTVAETWQRAKWMDGEWVRAKWMDGQWVRAKWMDDSWQRAKWMDGEWVRAKWMDGAWQRAKWMDGGWQRAKWMDDEWVRAKWMDAEWQRAKWMNDAWARAKWMEASFARAKWMDANFARAKWMEADWARAKWMELAWTDTELMSVPATFEEAETPAAPGDDAHPGNGNGNNGNGNNGNGNNGNGNNGNGNNGNGNGNAAGNGNGNSGNNGNGNGRGRP